MSDFSSEFLEFLRTNYPTDYQKATDEKVKPEVLNSIRSAHTAKFEIWEKVPTALRDRYGGVVPQEVLEAAARGEQMVLREMEYHPEIKRVEDAREIVLEKSQEQAKVVGAVAEAAFVAAVVAGYSEQAATELANNRQFRDSLKEKALNHTLTLEERKAWMESREKDIKAIKQDWIENRPEKMLLHLLAKHNRQLQKQDVKSLDDAKLSKDSVIPNAVGMVLPKPKDGLHQDDIVGQIADLVQKIESQGRQEHLLQYLQSKQAQAKISRFKPEVLDLFAHSVLPQVPNIDYKQVIHNMQQEKDLTPKQKAQLVSQYISEATSSLPRTITSPEEIRARMPSILNQGRTQ